MSKRTTISRRDWLRLGAGGALATALPGGLSYRPPRVAAQSGSSEKFLFVITAAGGASIVDSFLPVTTSECAAAGGDPNSVLCYPDSTVQSIPGTNIRAVTDLPISSFFGDVYGYSLPQFVGDHKNDLLILAHECTSVNHVVAQERSINGNGINSGRTLMEAFSQAYGSELAIPNCNMSTGGYLRYGTDASLDPRFRAEIISDPYLFAPSTHGSRGIANAPSSEQLARARGVRAQLENGSAFGNRYGDSRLRQRFLSSRRETQPEIESADLLTKLLLLSLDEATLAEFGVARSAEEIAILAELQTQFPGLAANDRLHAQGALAFLLAKYGVANAVTLGPGFIPNIVGADIVDSPIAFDFSHTDHPTAQNTMWMRMMKVVDGLIRMLRHPTLAAMPDGSSMWDHSLIYIATDFGRTKTRSGGSLSFGTGHDLVNGSVMISPLLQGNSIYGAVDHATAQPYSYNLSTGMPDPNLGVSTLGRNENLVMREGHVYSLICHALGIDFPGRIDMSGLVRSSA